MAPKGLDTEAAAAVVVEATAEAAAGIVAEVAEHQDTAVAVAPAADIAEAAERQDTAVAAAPAADIAAAAAEHQDTLAVRKPQEPWHSHSHPHTAAVAEEGHRDNPRRYRQEEHQQAHHPNCLDQADPSPTRPTLHPPAVHFRQALGQNHSAPGHRNPAEVHLVHCTHAPDL